MSPTMPAAEVTVDRPVLEALLREQHPDLAALPVTELAHGWDNVLFRIGPDLVARLPRRTVAAQLVEHEQRWLPMLAPRLPLPVPVPLRAGRPGCGYPWRWSIVAYLPGRVAAVSAVDTAHAADALAGFLARLHQPAPVDAPRNSFRGVALPSRNEVFARHLALLTDLVDRPAALRLWDGASAAAPWPGQPVWVHGDLHPANILARDRRVSGVIDFGDVTAGDPATDLSVAWMLLPPPDRRRFWAVYAAQTAHPVDPALELRARGWALALGLAFLAGSADNPMMQRVGEHTVAAALGGVG